MAMDVDATQLLLEVNGGNRASLDVLFQQVYDELRGIAQRRLRHYRPGVTLETTALVHEAYLRLIDQSRVQPRDRSHFLALASRAMRFFLVDYTRSISAQKRGGGDAKIPISAVQLAVEDRTPDLLVLNDALGRLSTVSERLAQVVECRFFGGLSFEEIGTAVGCSVPTVKRDWQRARAWLHHYMEATT